jgi:TonB family protein
MNRYLVFSSAGHVFLITGWLLFGSLLTKPRMSYYSIDLMSSLPAGGPAAGTAAVEQAPPDVPKEIVPPRPITPERRLPPKEVIKVQGKPKKITTAPATPRKKGLNLKAALAVLGENKGTGRSGSGVQGAGGAGIVGDAGPAFPYPWYLKAIADRLDKQWKPPENFQQDLLCQVAFVIARDGQVSNTNVEKSSGDSTFDQLATRAVLYSNPLPPLPAGFPDDTLRVHMKFVGKQN